MNFISEEVGEGQVELKYCERCGSLFLRMLGASIVQCAKCAARLGKETSFTTELNVHSQKRSRRPVRLSRGPNCARKLQGMGKIEYLQGAATAEVRVC